MNRIIKIGLGVIAPVILSWVLASGCFHSKAEKTEVPTVVIDPAELLAANIFNKHVVDSAVSLLQSGYIVVRMGLGADSKLLAALNSRDKTFSHCGIVMMENGYPFVYHSIGGEDNPDERLRRDSAHFFFSPLRNTEIGISHYAFDTGDINELRRVVTDYYKIRPRFDMKFDLQTDDKLYCSEFIYKAVNKAMKDTGYIKTSARMTGRFVGIDDIFTNEHANIIWQIKFK